MIKVLNDQKKQPKIYNQLCDVCRAELEFEYEDTYEGAFCRRYVRCPVCQREVLVDEIEGKELTPDNLEFPKHFYFTTDKVRIPDNEIQNWVRNCLKIAQESKEPYGYFVQQGTGDAMVVLLVYEDEDEFVVTRDYYSLTIPR